MDTPSTHRRAVGSMDNPIRFGSTGDWLAGLRTSGQSSPGFIPPRPDAEFPRRWVNQESARRKAGRSPPTPLRPDPGRTPTAALPRTG